ncbi:phytase [Sphingomonas flavalba]|uniref:phytase n=1 Tax=Sphingomonas flavalba TaxID=2559804 RepID=UPI00109DFA14|nr:phytase [Sphingomonas flavalba]
MKLVTTIGLLVGTALVPAAGFAQDRPATVTAAAETQAAPGGDANQAAIAVNPAAPEASRIVTTAESKGLQVHALDGRLLSTAEAGEAVGVALRGGFMLGGAAQTLVVSADGAANSLRFFTLAGDRLTEVGARAVPLDFAVENVCLFRNAPDAALYAIAVGDGGEIDQWMVYATPDGKVDARQARRITLPTKIKHCVADDASGKLYVAEQATGLWRFNGDPETDSAPALIDAPRIGRISEELGGIALYDAGPARWLIASDASTGRLFLYDRTKDDAYAGAVTMAGPGGTAVKEPGGLAATGAALGSGFGHGLLVAADEDAAGGANYKLVGFDALAAPLGLAVGTPELPPTSVAPRFPTVTARVETVPVAAAGDAADDPAIWHNPADPAASLIIGTDKKAGLYVYDMQGKVVHFAPVGRMNNVDLRDGFMLDGKPIVLVTASDRTRKAVAIYRLDTATGALIDIADGLQPSGLSDPYGLCMYRSTRSGRSYVIVSDPDGLNRQWELVTRPNGKVAIRQVRDIRFGSQTEGCVADDANGALYIAEEDVALWRVGAEPKAGDARRQVDSVAGNPALKDDLEGVSLYDLGNGRGYLVVSSQGNNSYAVYDRDGANAYRGSFAVVADGATGIDGISETDGLDVSSLPLGPGFEKGAMVAQDGRNVLPGEKQNFKIVSWADIAAALKLESR